MATDSDKRIISCVAACVAFGIVTGFYIIMSDVSAYMLRTTDSTEIFNIQFYFMISYYTAPILGSLLLSKICITFLGHKNMIIIGITLQIVWMAIHSYVRLYTYIPATVLSGLFASTWWAATASYVVRSALAHARKNYQNEDTTIRKYSGLFAVAVQFGIFLEALNSSTGAKRKEDPNGPAANASARCGIDACPSDISIPALQTIGWDALWVMYGLALGLSCIAVVLVVALVKPFDNHYTKEAKSKGRLHSFLAVFLQHKDYKQLLLIPVTIFRLHAFDYFFEFEYTWVICFEGVTNMGYLLMCFSSVSVVMTILLTLLSSRIPRSFSISTGFICYISLFVTLMNWTPTEGPALEPSIFVIAAFWGLADSILFFELNALYGCVFKSDPETGYATYRMWECTYGFAILIWVYLGPCAKVRVSILLAMLVLGMAGYFIVEHIESMQPISIGKFTDGKQVGATAYADSEGSIPYDNIIPAKENESFAVPNNEYNTFSNPATNEDNDYDYPDVQNHGDIVEQSHL